MVTIVTDKLYLLTERIISIYVDEEFEDHMNGNKRITIPSYKIIINFIPLKDSANNIPNNNNLRNEYMTVEMKTLGRKRTVLLFKDVVKQIREQCPDQLYLDKIIESFLTQEVEDDAGTEEICKLGKEEGRSEALLRRTKKRRSRGRKRSRR